MASRASLNKVLLIGNLTRDPELRYTPQGNAVCTFGLATNRSWLPAGSEERREETEFHRVVSWNKLAELCAQLLTKGRKVYVEGRLQTRSWQAPDGAQRQVTEVVIDDMRILDSKRATEVVGEVGELPIGDESEAATGEPPVVGGPASQTVTQEVAVADDQTKKPAKKTAKKGEKKEKVEKEEPTEEEEDILKDLPF